METALTASQNKCFLCVTNNMKNMFLFDTKRLFNVDITLLYMQNVSISLLNWPLL